MDDYDENIFDEDDTLDYVLYKEVVGNNNQSKPTTGCLGLIAIVTIPSFLLGLFTAY